MAAVYRAAGWNAAGTGATNLGPTSATLIAQVAKARAAWEALNGTDAPIDAVTTSGWGLDPHISPENALAQADRIAAACGADPATLRDLIDAGVEAPTLSLYDLARVNVPETNLELAAASPMAPAPWRCAPKGSGPEPGSSPGLLDWSSGHRRINPYSQVGSPAIAPDAS